MNDSFDVSPESCYLAQLYSLLTLTSSQGKQLVNRDLLRVLLFSD
jgi:hypothetical protein